MQALSIRQPWASLLVSGKKQIEIRRWYTNVRGDILIHASNTPDSRADAWAWMEPDAGSISHLYGGIIGKANLVDVILYKTPDHFALDVPRHLNYADWFQVPVMYGFVFENPVSLPFRRYRGDVKFFEVADNV
jgi:hypothetical protein